MKIRSYAKINLTLDIRGRRDDGYHELETVFQQVSLHDDVVITPRPDGEIAVSAGRADLDGGKNICHRAAALMKERFGIRDGVSITITKRIPVGAGLSGGSSNAAAVLKGMNHMFRLELGQGELAEIGAELGMDVAFHVIGGTCAGRGRGEILEPLPPLPKMHVVIVYPGFSISTAGAYGSLAYEKTGRQNATARFIDGYDPRFLHNDFEYSIIDRYPEIARVKSLLGEHALLSGSGSCVFGLYRRREEAEFHYRRAAREYAGAFLVGTVNKRISYAKKMGFCSGVRRAIDGIMDVADEEGVHVLGSLVHNGDVIRRLAEGGVKFVDDQAAVNRGTIVISAHGAPEAVIGRIRERGLRLRDLTCPMVSKLQRLTLQKEREGKKVVLLGDRGHPEVVGVAGNLSDCTVIQGPEDVPAAAGRTDIYLASQTTADEETFNAVAKRLAGLGMSVEVGDSVCPATRDRQESARDLARRSDLVLIVGGKMSANTRRLHEICSKKVEARLIESGDELDPEWFADRESIGITAGASTPGWVIESVEKKLRLLL